MSIYITSKCFLKQSNLIFFILYFPLLVISNKSLSLIFGKSENLSYYMELLLKYIFLYEVFFSVIVLLTITKSNYDEVNFLNKLTLFKSIASFLLLNYYIFFFLYENIFFFFLIYSLSILNIFALIQCLYQHILLDKASDPNYCENVPIK